MNKSLVVVLALILVFAFAGSAFAATNPFVDVPKGHWAYDAVSKLAQDGVIIGDSATTLDGSKVVTRFEMAKVVANAVSKMNKANAQDKALIEKLGKEFAEELANMNVRVEKLEQQANRIHMGAFAMLKYDNRTWSGTAAYWASKSERADIIRGGFKFVEMVDYDLGNGWRFSHVGEYDRNQETGDMANGNRDNAKTLDINGKIDDVNVHLGKFHYMDSASGFVFADEINGAGMSFGNKLKVTANLGWLNTTDCSSNPNFHEEDIFGFSDAKGPRYGVADVSYALSPTTNVAYIYHHLSKPGAADGLTTLYIHEFGFDTKLTPDLTLKVAGSKSSWTDDNKGYFFGLAYGRADFFRPGSWEAYLNYSRTDSSASIANFWDAEDGIFGSQGTTIGGTYTLRPKVQLETKYIIQHATTTNSAYTSYHWHDKFFRIQLNFMLM
ncbi:MAG: S-layer protein [Firmicutes bacterium]|nr:S-layer protein [Bacillota bacterium]